MLTMSCKNAERVAVVDRSVDLLLDLKNDFMMKNLAEK